MGRNGNKIIGGTMKVIETKKAPSAVGPYSQAIEVDGFLFTSGQLPLVPETGELISDSIEDATRRSLDNVIAIVEEAGAKLEDIVKVTIFLDDMDDFAAFNEVYGEYFNEHKPARSAIEVARLPLDGIVEIEAIVKL